MSDQLSHFIRGLQGDQKRLHDFICIAESEILKVILRISVNDLAASPADQVVGVKLGALSGADLGEIHFKHIGDLINDADGHVFAVLLVGGIDFRVQLQFFCQFFNCIVAGFTQFSQSCANLVIFIHCIVSFRNICKFKPRACPSKAFFQSRLVFLH